MGHQCRAAVDLYSLKVFGLIEVPFLFCAIQGTDRLKILHLFSRICPMSPLCLSNP